MFDVSYMLYTKEEIEIFVVIRTGFFGRILEFWFSKSVNYYPQRKKIDAVTRH